MGTALVEGVAVLVKIGTGSGSVAILGQEDAKLTIETDLIDCTTKASPGRAREYIAGDYRWNVECNGLLYAGGDRAFGSLVAAQLAREPVEVVMDLNGDLFTGKAFYHKTGAAGKENDRGVFAAILRGTGELTPPSYPTGNTV